MQLYEKLKAYEKTDAYPFHMPGHKRRLGAVEEIRGIDITEIESFDNLHHAEGILKEAQERAARLYGSDDTYFLVNGSTAGILAAISACVRPGGKILMARNSHKAAYHAAEIRGLQVIYLYPTKVYKKGVTCETLHLGGSISPEDVRMALEEEPGIEAVFITSPTYEGIVSDIAQIAAIVHAFHIPLIVDEAHGAHFGFHPDFPKSSVKAGADLVIHSLHKTLPSLTQTALLHRMGLLVKHERIQKFLDIYQSSSPSYVLMVSMDSCISLLEQRQQELFDTFTDRLKMFAKRMCDLKNISYLHGEGTKKLVGVYERDPSKMVLFAKGHSGKWLSDLLREEFQLELEMTAGDYAIALSSIADTQEGFDRLFAALQKIEEKIDRETLPKKEQDGERQVFHSPDVGKKQKDDNIFIRNEQVMTIAEADRRQKRKVTLTKSDGLVSAEYIYVYPPGIPMVVPGERISERLLKQIEACYLAGLSLQGLEDYSGERITIIDS